MKTIRLSTDGLHFTVYPKDAAKVRSIHETFEECRIIINGRRTMRGKIIEWAESGSSSNRTSEPNEVKVEFMRTDLPHRPYRRPAR